jgi:hypothetical protein
MNFLNDVWKNGMYWHNHFEMSPEKFMYIPIK